MKCPSCNKIIRKTDKNCKFCGIKIESNNIREVIKTEIVYKEVENKVNKWLVFFVGLLSFILIIETSFNIWYFFIKEPHDDIKYQITSFNYKVKYPYDIVNTNEDFEFDDLILNVSNKYSILALDNKYSIYDGQKVIKIPVSITNKKGKDYSLNLYYYDIFDNLGNSIDEVAGYFEEALYYAEDIKDNESYTKYIYALYYDNDYYTIKFENKDKTIFLKYIINKDLTIKK